MITMRMCTFNGVMAPAIVDGKLYLCGWVKRFVVRHKYGIYK